jgi:hypothetical protein
MSELPVGIVNDPELATLIEATDVDSLSCTYDEETRQMHFNWDADKNPEYNYLLSMTSEELIEKMLRWATSEDAAVNSEAE